MGVTSSNAGGTVAALSVTQAGMTEASGAPTNLVPSAAPKHAFRTLTSGNCEVN